MSLRAMRLSRCPRACVCMEMVLHLVPAASQSLACLCLGMVGLRMGALNLSGPVGLQSVVAVVTPEGEGVASS